jgi:hypothetical protein
VAESIFTSQTPATPDANDGASTLGTVFTVAVNGTIDGCRWFASTVAPTGTVQALLYQWTNDATGTLLAQTNFGVITPAAWNTVNYAVPVAVVPGQRYVTCIFTPDHYAFTNFVFTSAPIVNGNLTAVQDNPGGSPHNGKFIQNATPTYPTNEFRQSNYFADVLFTASAAASGVPIDTADSTSSAFAISVLATLTLAITGASEVDEAFVITPQALNALPVSTADETDAAFAITPQATATLAVGTADETDAAESITLDLEPLVVNVDTADETDVAGALDAVVNQVVDIATAEELNGASLVTVRSAGVGNPFNSTGPCSPLDDWEPIWCETLSAGAAAVTGDAVQMAAEILWIATGQRFGLCEVTIRPCRQECWDGYNGWDQWWPGVGGTRGVSGGGPRPWWWNGMWYNVCGSCPGSCSCTMIDTALLPAPTREVVRVMLDGVVMDPTTYRVDENRKLVRTDGQLWPMCQDMAAADDQPGTWSVTLTVGEDVPTLGRRAMGQLAAELARDCAGEDCSLSPYEVTSISRQGVNLSFGSPNEVDPAIGQMGLRWVSLFVNTYNPNGLKRRGKVYDVDRNPSPWRRVDTI